MPPVLHEFTVFFQLPTTVDLDELQNSSKVYFERTKDYIETMTPPSMCYTQYPPPRKIMHNHHRTDSRGSLAQRVGKRIGASGSTARTNSIQSSSRNKSEGHYGGGLLFLKCLAKDWRSPGFCRSIPRGFQKGVEMMRSVFRG